MSRKCCKPLQGLIMVIFPSILKSIIMLSIFWELQIELLSWKKNRKQERRKEALMPCTLQRLWNIYCFVGIRALVRSISASHLWGSGPCQSKSNQYWLISQISVISILYNLGILHFMYRLPMKTWAYILSRQCLTWPFQLIMCQNYLMLNAAGSILTLEIKFTPQWYWQLGLWHI